MKDDPGARRPLTWTTTIIATAGLVLLLINPASLTSWLDQRDPDSVPTGVRTAIGALWDFDASLGLTAPRAAISEGWSRARATAWPARETRSNAQR